MVDSKENIKQYLGSENIKDNFIYFKWWVMCAELLITLC